MSTSGVNAGFYKEYPNSQCSDGLKEYRETYIDPFAEVLERFTDRVPVVLVIEPDSLPNLVTNMADKRPSNFRGCHQETKISYEKGVKYAVEKLGTTGAELYVDAGHGGWLVGQIQMTTKQGGLHRSLRVLRFRIMSVVLPRMLLTTNPLDNLSALHLEFAKGGTAIIHVAQMTLAICRMIGTGRTMN
jgi:hypothetical protein